MRRLTFLPQRTLDQEPQRSRCKETEAHRAGPNVRPSAKLSVGLVNLEMELALYVDASPFPT